MKAKQPPITWFLKDLAEKFVKSLDLRNEKLAVPLPRSPLLPSRSDAAAVSAINVTDAIPVSFPRWGMISSRFNLSSQ